jgi:hypothetical protein
MQALHGRTLCGCHKEWNYQINKREVEIMVHLSLGMVTLEMVIVGEAPLSTYRSFSRDEKERDHCVGEKSHAELIFSRSPHQSRSNERNRRPVWKRITIQEKKTSIDRSIT